MNSVTITITGRYGGDVAAEIGEVLGHAFKAFEPGAPSDLVGFRLGRAVAHLMMLAECVEVGFDTTESTRRAVEINGAALVPIGSEL